MNVIYSSNYRRFSTKRLLATALLLGAALVATPLLAAQTAQADAVVQVAAQAQSLAAARNSEALEVSSSRINGRIDWDVDYPSQLAPQPVHAASQKVTVSATAAAATEVTVR
jgi:hypothetical protein